MRRVDGRATAYAVEERLAFLQDFEPSGDVARDMEEFIAGIGSHDVLTARQEKGRSLGTLGMQFCVQSAREAMRLAREPIHPSSRYAQWSRTRRRQYEQMPTIQANVLHEILDRAGPARRLVRPGLAQGPHSKLR
jgi:hypothetical protein